MDYLKQYVRFCFFKTNLNDLPKSLTFLQVSLVVYFVVSFFIQANIGHPLEAFIESLIEMVVTTILIFILLIFAGKFSSFVQTFTAFIVAENIFFAMMFPILFWIDLHNDPISLTVCGVIISLCIFWYLCVITYLIRQLLSISKPAAFTVSLGYTLITYVGPFMMLQF
jgi:hypothetical protein